jgi:hypothetical protein
MFSSISVFFCVFSSPRFCLLLLLSSSICNGGCCCWQSDDGAQWRSDDDSFLRWRVMSATVFPVYAEVPASSSSLVLQQGEEDGERLMVALLVAEERKNNGGSLFFSSFFLCNLLTCPSVFRSSLLCFQTILPLSPSIASLFSCNLSLTSLFFPPPIYKQEERDPPALSHHGARGSWATLPL